MVRERRSEAEIGMGRNGGAGEHETKEATHVLRFALDATSPAGI